MVLLNRYDFWLEELQDWITPIVNSFASFLNARGNEQIYNATEGSKIIYLSLYAGAIPAGAESHQSLRDISLLSNILNLESFSRIMRSKRTNYLNTV